MSGGWTSGAPRRTQPAAAEVSAGAASPILATGGDGARWRRPRGKRDWESAESKSTAQALPPAAAGPDPPGLPPASAAAAAASTTPAGRSPDAEERFRTSDARPGVETLCAGTAAEAAVVRLGSAGAEAVRRPREPWGASDAAGNSHDLDSIRVHTGHSAGAAFFSLMKGRRLARAVRGETQSRYKEIHRVFKLEHKFLKSSKSSNRYYWRGLYATLMEMPGHRAPIGWMGVGTLTRTATHKPVMLCGVRVAGQR